MLTLTSETPSSEDHFENKFQSKISSSDKSFEKQEEELIEFTEEEKMEQKKLSPEHIENEVLTLTYETSSSEY